MTARRILGVAAVVLASSAAAGPDWAPGDMKLVRVLDDRSSVVRVITERTTLDDFAASLATAAKVKGRSRQQWTHKLDIEGPHGGRWLYDAATGEFAFLSKRLAPVYRVAPAAKTRFDALILARPGGAEAPIQPAHASSAGDASRACTREADAPVPQISASWEALYAHFKRFGHCDDGAVYEGFSESVLTLLNRSWEQLLHLDKLIRQDDQFGPFVLRHVDDLTGDDTLRRMRERATKACPRECAQLCAQIAASADRILGRQTQPR